MASQEIINRFLALSKEQQKRLVDIAKERAESGKCFLCSWIISKVRFDDFPRDARIAHLILDCSRDLKVAA